MSATRRTCRPGCRARCPSPTGSTRRTGTGTRRGRAARPALPRLPRLAVGAGVDLPPLLSASTWSGRPCAAGRIYSWERAWHPVHPALREQRPLHRRAGRAARRGRRPHGRQSARRSAAGGHRSARRWRRCSSPTTTPTPPFTLVQWRRTRMSTTELVINEPEPAGA